MRGGFSLFSNELQEDDVFLDVYRCGHLYGLTSQLQILVLFQSPHVHKRSCVMRDVLESRISLNIFQPALPEDVRRCQEDLDRYLLAFWVESMIDAALFARLEYPGYFFQFSYVENLQDCQKRPFVKDFFESLQIFARFYPDSSFPVISLLTLLQFLVDFVRQGGLALMDDCY